MTDRPIIYSAPEIRALLDGRKTMTRRLVSPSTCTVNGYRYSAKSSVWRGLKFDHPAHGIKVRSLEVPYLHPDYEARDIPWEADPIFCRVRPIIEPGDRLWVREMHWRFGYWRRNGKTASGRQKWKFVPMDRISPPMFADTPPTGQFGRKSNRTQMGWWKRPSIHMPRWASRLTLVVTAVKIERLQEITSADAIAEGIRPSANSMTIDCETPDPRDHFAAQWDSIHGEGSWDANPYVVALTFETHKVNIDAMP